MNLPSALPPLLGHTTSELQQLVQQIDQPAYRGEQLAEWLYRRDARTLEEMTNLPQSLRFKLAQRYQVGRSRVVLEQNGKDGTVKLLLEMRDGARVETVGLPYPDRSSCCVSTQVGCPMGCAFCATGFSGYTRDLAAGEIVDQVLAAQEQLQRQPAGSPDGSRRIDHVVFMGMGEPLLNYDATLKAVRLLNSELGIAMRQITVSTVGFVPGILKLAREGLQLTLAVSLHAPTDDLRRRLIPGMTRWRVAVIIDACRDYVRLTGRRVTFEYCLLDGVNDGIGQAQELARLLRGLNCHVNLISFNPVSELPFRAPSREHIRTFREILESASIQVTQRAERGSDIDAACGQLRLREANAGAAE